MKNGLWIAGVFVITAFAGCGSVPDKGAAKVAYVPGAKVDLRNTALVKENLYAQYSQWKNTKYQIGGLSRNGIDCSGFVYMTFKSRLGRVLPRSTAFQVELGETIDQNQLRAGDLVFFRTGMTGRHVGIYLEQGRFLHASTSQGVIISRLDENYWKSAYWKAKRLDG
ncbi:MAG: NlpC/P60 family protein [Nitrosospira sp.]|nr:NlpC/P60 family protein [Nitrosospira sp.]